MADDKNKAKEGQVDTKPAEPQDSTDPATEPKDEPKSDDKPQDTPSDKPTDEPKADTGAEGEPPVEEPSEEPTEPELPKLSVEDELKAENFGLKTQLEAMKLGFIPEYIDDAVVLAENIVKREGSDIVTALKAVAKKYPDWKQQAGDKGKHKGGFKIGSDGGNSKPTSEDKLNNAFGIKKKG